MSARRISALRMFLMGVTGVLAASATACGDATAKPNAAQTSTASTASATPSTPTTVATDSSARITDALATPGVATAPTDTARDASSSAALANSISGTLEPEERAVLRTELSGAVRTLTVKVGQAVAAGSIVATLDVPAVRAAMAAAEAQLIAQEASLKQAQRERERVAQLLAVGGVSKTEMDDWETRVQAADAAWQSAKAQRASAAADVARLTVRAPFAGVVERRSTTQGSVVQAGDELLSIIDTRTLELEASLAFTTAHTVRPGTPVSLRIAGLSDGPVTARVARVAPALDPVTRQRRIIIVVPNARGRIPAGAWAEGAVLPTGGAR